MNDWSWLAVSIAGLILGLIIGYVAIKTELRDGMEPMERDRRELVRRRAKYHRD